MTLSVGLKRAMTLLYLDFDGRLPARLVDRVTWCTKLWRWPVEAMRIDRTRNGWHVVVGVGKRLAPPLILAAQAILGSDWKREAYNLQRVQHLDRLPAYWRARWNVLYHVHAKERR